MQKKIKKIKNTSGVVQRWEFWLEWMAWSEGRPLDIHDLFYLWEHKQFPNWGEREN